MKYRENHKTRVAKKKSKPNSFNKSNRASYSGLEFDVWMNYSRLKNSKKEVEATCKDKIQV